MKELFYDLEIIKCIPTKDKDDRYEYCDGWCDFTNMGISVIGYCFEGEVGSLTIADDKYALRRLADFQDMVYKADRVVGFNSISFDDNLMAANKVKVKTDYDLLCEIRVATGQPPHFTPGITKGGYSLNAIAQVNLNFEKTGNGELAPKLWQDGKYNEVIEYCKNDVRLLVELYKKRHNLIDPTNGNTLICKE